MPRLLSLLLLLPLLSLTPPSAPQSPSSNLITNGDFSDGARGWFDSDDQAIPSSPRRAMVALDPRGGIDRSPGLRVDARGRSHGVSVSCAPFQFSAGRRYRLSYRARRAGEENIQFSVKVQWVTAGGRVRGGPLSRNSLVTSEEWRSYGYDFVVPPGIERARVEFSAPVERGGFLDDVRVEELVGELAVLSFATGEVVTRVGEAAEMVVRVENRGGAPIGKVRGEVKVAGKRVAVDVAELGAGEVRELSVELPGLKVGVHTARLSLRGRKSTPAQAACQVLVFDPEQEGVEYLRSGDARLAFHRAGKGHALIVLEVREQALVAGSEEPAGWRVVGALPGLAGVRGAGDKVDTWLVGEVEVVEDTAHATASHGGLRCELTWRASGDGWFELRAELKALRTVDLLRFVFPELHAGWGAGGRAKHSAVFGGLEFLDAQQFSSGTEAMIPELAPRYVPHPYDVAIPVMAVEQDGLALGLAWDPEQRWDGRRAMPSSLFASPNRWMQQDDHLMALFLPSAPEFVRPGEDRAKYPYTLRRGQKLTLEAELFALRVEVGVEEVLAEWYRRHGAPRSRADWHKARKKSAAAMLASYDERVSGWPFAGGDDPGFFAPVAQAMLVYGLDERGPLARRTLAQVDSAVAAALRRGEATRFGIELALHVGHVLENLNAARGALRHAKDQRGDGSWGYRPDKGENSNKRLGEPGDAALGVSADRLNPLMEYARATGDLRALRAVTKGLAFTESLRIPTGSQTWEIPILAPDLLSAQEGLDLQLDAYELTGDERHLAEALRWARSGLAFITTWEAAERPGQRYASTAVFGGTFFGAPWWGRPVQWIGIVYAGSILRLAPHDPDFPWREIAEGLVVSCIEQQTLAEDPRAHNDWPGSYADFYRLSDNLLLGKWIGPWSLVRQLNHLLGLRASSRQRLSQAGARDLYLTSAARIVECVLEDRRLTATLEYTPSRSCHTLLAPVGRPEAVQVDGHALEPAADLDLVEEGWHYDAKLRTLIVKHAFARSTLTLALSGVAGQARSRR